MIQFYLGHTSSRSRAPSDFYEVVRIPFHVHLIEEMDTFLHHHTLGIPWLYRRVCAVLCRRIGVDEWVYSKTRRVIIQITPQVRDQIKAKGFHD